ncbi:PRELI-like family-domain-containing protein [Polychytrium aggregatum]|uniref:PRELI-like family-domain-containing protein n=1 Tax=Polychytrium aggregatum TaxID=110093 RepID=UPI0022FDB19B|nr:PRELI-like family-domain-containing protein [Polychytrium aggregatum]KAI9206018.1 PRELI-like family-domain-containing protein [Polychytrium aggregatum]
MKLFESTHSFPHSWSTLTTANWRKYPNELSQHVIACDVLSREIDPATGVLRTERLLTCKQNIPSIVHRLGLPVPQCMYFLEVSYLDPAAQTYTAVSTNLMMRGVLTVEETCKFRQVESDPSSTQFDQKVSITALGALSTFARLVEDAAINRFKSNAHKGRAALESVIDKVVDEARAVESRVAEGLEGLRKDLQHGWAGATHQSQPAQSRN